MGTDAAPDSALHAQAVRFLTTLRSHASPEDANQPLTVTDEQREFLRGKGMSDEQIEHAMQRRSASFGSALRSRWRLPFGLRELISAFYGLGGGVFSREALLLNLSGLLLALAASEQPASLAEARCVRMLRLDLRLLERLPAELYRSA